MSNEESIHKLIELARSELSREKTKALLRSAIKKYESSDSREDFSASDIALVYADLAIEDDSPSNREKLWESALHILEETFNQKKQPSIADAYGMIAVNCVQDTYNIISQVEKNKILHKAKDFIDRFDVNNIDEQKFACLLSRKSAILRHLSRFATATNARYLLLGKSIRCAEKAVGFSNEPAIVLELGLAKWAIARYEIKDCNYTFRLREAEDIFINASLKQFEPAQLTIPRFYRMNFQPLKACDSFPLLNINIKNRRRLLREAYIYAEAAIQLWHQKYPSEVINPHLKEAENILEQAVASGYENARMIIDLAFIKKIRNSCSVIDTTISNAFGNILVNKEIDWNEVMDHVKKNIPSSLTEKGFALGVADGNVWSQLGTYFLVFENKSDLALAMYETGVKLDPHNPIVLTNLARLEISTGELLRAERHLTQARQFSDRRFAWWKNVHDELLKEKEKKEVVAPDNSVTEGADFKLSRRMNMAQIRHSFPKVEKLTNHQNRGYMLEYLIHNVAMLTPAIRNAKSSFRFTETLVQKKHQVDGYFEFNGSNYFYECKWENEKSTYDYMLKFWNNLKTTGLSGIFISMGGFDETAINFAREKRGDKMILLMEGSEISYIMSGSMNLDSVLTEKKLHFLEKGDPYHLIHRQQQCA